MDRVRIGAMVGVLVLLAGCGALGRSGNKGPAGPAPKPAEVIDAMRADVVAAVQAAMPEQSLREPTYKRQNCTSSMWKDTPGSSKIIEIEIAAVDGVPTDKRPLDQIIAVMVKALQARGWKLNESRYPATSTMKELAKSGVHGVVRLAGGYFDLDNGGRVPTVNGTMLSDCLPNPDATGKG